MHLMQMVFRFVNLPSPPAQAQCLLAGNVPRAAVPALRRVSGC